MGVRGCVHVGLYISVFMCAYVSVRCGVRCEPY